MEILVRVVHRLWRATLRHSLPAFVLIGSAGVLATAEAQALFLERFHRLGE